MPKPVTPLCGCDVFVINERTELLLIKRSDNGLWALPGGCQDLGETAKECAVRECFEETGFVVEIEALLGIWSSQRYPYLTYPWKDNEFSHLVFKARIISGKETPSNETTEVGWFSENSLPDLSDGHPPRIDYGFKWLRDRAIPAYYE